jgi:hypothetical protein
MPDQGLAIEIFNLMIWTNICEIFIRLISTWNVGTLKVGLSEEKDLDLTT